MRATRGLFAGLGASGSVCAAGACALLVVSAAIGLDGWPGIGRGELAPRTLVVGTATAPRTQHAGRPSSPAPARILLATEPGVRGPRRPRASRRVGSPATAEAPASAPPVVTAAPRTNDAAPPFATRRPSEPVRRAAGAGGDALTRTGGTLGSAIAPASPAAGQAVGATTKTTGAAAQSAGQAAGDAVDRVLGP